MSLTAGFSSECDTTSQQRYYIFPVNINVQTTRVNKFETIQTINR